jgi:hypothetical protein
LSKSKGSYTPEQVYQQGVQDTSHVVGLGGEEEGWERPFFVDR